MKRKLLLIGLTVTIVAIVALMIGVRWGWHIPSNLSNISSEGLLPEEKYLQKREVVRRLQFGSWFSSFL